MAKLDPQNRKSMNLRNIELTGKEGKNPTEAENIMPGASPSTPADKEMNKTEQYFGGEGAGSGPWGGEAQNI